MTIQVSLSKAPVFVARVDFDDDLETAATVRKFKTLDAAKAFAEEHAEERGDWFTMKDKQVKNGKPNTWYYMSAQLDQRATVTQI